MSSGFTIATTACPAIGQAFAWGLAAGAVVGAWFDGSAGFVDRFNSPDGALAGAVTVSAAVPNFGSAKAIVAVPARRRIAVVETRRRSIGTPGITSSPLSPANRSQNPHAGRV